MMELSEASTCLAPDSPPPELAEPESLPRAKPHLSPLEKSQVAALLREYAHLDQLMAETIVLTNPACDDVIAMENRAIEKLKAEKREPAKDSVEPSVTVE